MHARLFSTGILLAFVFAGCTSAEPVGLVSGTLTLDNKPYPHAAVVFSNHERGIHIAMNVDSQGKFTLRTAKGPGLPVGIYYVSVTPPIDENPPMVSPVDPPPARPPGLPKILQKYGDPATSGLVVEVHKGNNEIPLAMESSL